MDIPTGLFASFDEKTVEKLYKAVPDIERVMKLNSAKCWIYRVADEAHVCFESGSSIMVLIYNLLVPNDFPHVMFESKHDPMYE